MSSILDAVSRDASRGVPPAQGPAAPSPGSDGRGGGPGRYRAAILVVVFGVLAGAVAARVFTGDEAPPDDLLTAKVAAKVEKKAADTKAGAKAPHRRDKQDDADGKPAHRKEAPAATATARDAAVAPETAPPVAVPVPPAAAPAPAAAATPPAAPLVPAAPPAPAAVDNLQPPPAAQAPVEPSVTVDIVGAVATPPVELPTAPADTQAVAPPPAAPPPVPAPVETPPSAAAVIPKEAPVDPAVTGDVAAAPPATGAPATSPPAATEVSEEKPTGAPEVSILFVAWSRTPSSRMASMRIGAGPLSVVHEGEYFEGMQVSAIHPEAVDFFWTGQKFRVLVRPF